MVVGVFFVENVAQRESIQQKMTCNIDVKMCCGKR